MINLLGMSFIFKLKAILSQCECLQSDDILSMIDNFMKFYENQPQNQDDQLISTLPKTKSKPTQVYANSKLKSIIIKLATLLVVCFIALRLAARYLERRSLKLNFIYPYSTVGIPQIGQGFNFSEVQKDQKYEFQSRLAEMFQPYNSTNCQLDTFAGIILCRNLIKSSQAIVSFATEQSNNFYCLLEEQYNITSFMSICKGSFNNDCISKSQVQSKLCLGQVTDRIFLTHYKTFNQFVSQHALTQKHLIVKMSVHENEWASFRSMGLADLQWIDQMILQIDIEEAYLWGNIDSVSTILNKFYPVDLHMHNSYCRQDREIQIKMGKFQSTLFTVTLVNKNIIQLNSNSRSFKPNNKHNKSRPNLRDCQMPYQAFQVIEKPVTILQIPWTDQNFHSLTQQHIHGITVYERPTVGMKLAATPFNYQKIQQNDRIMYYDLIAQLFKPYNDSDCQFARFGDNFDQGYILCKNMLNLSVAVINFGIEGKDSFGCQISTQFQIPNLQYDCTSQKRPFCRNNNNGNHYFYACISQRSENIPTMNRTYYSIRDVIDRHNLKGKHITLKIDIEGSEWPSFRSLPVSYLDYVDQLIIQFHLFQNTGYFKGNYNILKTLTDLFYPVNFHQNNYNCWMYSRSKLRSSVFEVTLVNKKLLKLRSQSRSFKSNVLNQPNTRHTADCQIDEQSS